MSGASACSMRHACHQRSSCLTVLRVVHACKSEAVLPRHVERAMPALCFGVAGRNSLRPEQPAWCKVRGKLDWLAYKACAHFWWKDLAALMLAGLPACMHGVQG